MRRQLVHIAVVQRLKPLLALRSIRARKGVSNSTDLGDTTLRNNSTRALSHSIKRT